MAESDPVALMEALVGAEMKHEAERLESERASRCVVTISRDCGSGGSEVAELLGARLGVEVYDKQILDAIAKDAHIDRYLMERLDERIQSLKDEWALSLLTGKDATRDTYRRHLITVILGIATRGGIILGRGAHFVLDPRKAFRVRITGSHDRCVERLAAFLNVTQSQAEKRVKASNAEAAEFIKKQFGRSLDEHGAYDLILNSDRFTAAQMADLVVHGMLQCGFPVP